MATTFDPSFQRVLEGHFTHPPKPPAKVVRVFLSSTFTDYSVERNALIQRVYPVIKRYCREHYGIDFQVVDMRWGIRQDAHDDHRENDICLKEIETAQRVSAGPNFILLLGQRYGSRSLNHHVPADEFEMFRDLWTQQQVDSDHLVLMDTWFKRDDNAIPPVYVLQRISSLLPNFMNNDEGEASEADRTEWRRIESIIYGMLKKAAEECHRAGKLSEDRLQVYTVSVTEREILNGVLTAADLSRRVLVFNRIIDGIDLKHVKASRFVDMIGDEVDEEARVNIARLKDQVFAAVDEKNVFRYPVRWSEKGGIDADEHAAYVDDFCEKFRTECVRLIDEAAQRERKNVDPLYTEIIEHARHCYESVRVFMGREDLVGKMREFITDAGSEAPFVVHGQSGSGKTTVMAKAAMECHSWLSDPQHTRVILRFLGTTPNSSSISVTLRSLCTQIIAMYNLNESAVLTNDMDELQRCFSRLLFEVPTGHKLCIFLDSLDQLSTANDAHDLFWVPRHLPPNVKLVLSVLPGSILNRLNSIFEASASSHSLQVNALTAETSMDILLTWFGKNHRQLSLLQQETLKKHLDSVECLPLHIKLIFNKTRDMASYDALDNSDLPRNVPANIKSTFQKLMVDHGEKLVWHALAYLTLNKVGISETELEDLLSLDDEVLCDVYQFHLPSVRRLPSILWARIRHDIEDYIVEREADGVSVISWYHRQFIEAATALFVSRNPQKTEARCRLMIEYFLGTWSGQAKPFTYSQYWQKKMALTSGQGKADRLVPDQCFETIVTDPRGNKIVRYNRRKLSTMPALLTAMGAGAKVAWKSVFDQYHFSYEYWHGCFSTRRLEFFDIVNAFVLFPSEFDDDPNVTGTGIFLFGTLIMIVSLVNDYPHNLAAQLCGRMLSYYGIFKFVASLIDKCDEVGPKHCALVSPHRQLPASDGGELFSMKKHTEPIRLFARSCVGNFLAGISNQLVLVDMRQSKPSTFELPSSERPFHRLYLHGDDDNLFAIVASPTACFVFAETNGCVIFSHQIPPESENLICDVVAISTLIAVSKEKQHSVEVYDFKKKTLVTRLESPVDSGCVRKLVFSPCCYANQAIEMFWVFWENGDLTCHDPENLTAVAALEEVKVPVKCAFWATESGVVSLLENGMLVVFSFEDGSITHNISLLRQRLPDDCYDLVYTCPGGTERETVLFCCKNSFHVVRIKPGSKQQDLPAFHGFSEETYDRAMINLAGNYLFVSRQGTIKVFKIVQHEDRLRFDLFKVLEPHLRTITTILPHVHEDRSIVTAAEDGVIKILRIIRNDEMTLLIDRTEAKIIKIAAQRTTAVTIDETRSCVTVWNILEGKIATSLKLDAVFDAVLSGDEKTVAASTTNGAIALFRLTETTDGGGQPASVINNKTPSKLLYSDNRKSVIAITADRVSLISDSNYRVESIRLETDLNTPHCLQGDSLVAVSPDHKRVVILSFTSKSVTRQIPIGSHQPIQSIYPADDNSAIVFSGSKHLTSVGVNSVGVTPIAEHVIMVSAVASVMAFLKNDSIQICSLPSLDVVQEIELDSSKKYSHLCLTPDGQYLVYMTLPLELHLRRVRGGALLGVYCMQTDVCMLAISTDSHFVMAGTEDRRLFVLLIVDPEVPEHFGRIKALPSRMAKEVDDEAKRKYQMQLQMAFQPKPEYDRDTADDPEVDEDEMAFLEGQECAELPGWALNTHFIYNPRRREQQQLEQQDDTDPNLNTAQTDSITENENALARAAAPSQACSIL